MTKIIGILNLTPDSFSDGGLYTNLNAAVGQAERLLALGSDWVDVGAESTKPQAQTITLVEEWGRMTEFWNRILASENLNITQFSLDTQNPETAEKFLQLGGQILNDVSGFQHKSMIDLAVRFKTACIINHFPGAGAAEVHEQNIGSIKTVKKDLLHRAQQLIKAGVSREKIILDPGIGFGKTPELNQQLLSFATLVPEWPVLIGHSKKRFLGEGRFEKEANVKAAQIAMASGAAYLRVHDPEWYLA